MKWIDTLFSPIILGPVVILAILIWGYLRMRQVRNFARHRRGAEAATARLVHVDESINSERTGLYLVNMTLEVHPPQGSPYGLKNVKWYVEPAAASTLQEGLILKIRIDRDDRMMIYPVEPWARPA